MNLKNAARIITVAAISQILGYAYALPGHIGEATWSDHAQFHLVLSWIWLLGINIAIIFIAWGTLQQRDQTSFWVLFVLFLSAQGGHFISSIIVPAGRPGEWWYNYALGTMALIFAVGLGVAWKALSNSSSK